MNRFATTLLAAVALASVATPALAEKSDRVVVQIVRDRIVAARAEPGVAFNGGEELDRADAALRDLYKALDNNEPRQVASINRRIDTLIETARLRARIAALDIPAKKVAARR